MGRDRSLLQRRYSVTVRTILDQAHQRALESRQGTVLQLVSSLFRLNVNGANSRRISFLSAMTTRLVWPKIGIHCLHSSRSNVRLAVVTYDPKRPNVTCVGPPYGETIHYLFCRTIQHPP